MREDLGTYMAASLRISEKVPALAEALLRREAAWPCSQEDARQHFAFLARALEFRRPMVFERHAAWCKATFTHRAVHPAVLAQQLRAMVDVLEQMLPAREATAAVQYVHSALETLARAPSSLEHALGAIPPEAKGYLARLLEADAEAAREIARECLQRMGVADLYAKVLAPAMNEAGLLWQCNRISVAQEHYCAGVTQMVMGEANASLRSMRGGRTAVVACVAGEQHSLGSRMVADYFDMAGWRSVWLGASTPGADLLRTVVELRADLLALSCSYAPCLHEVATLITALRVLPECAHVKVLVGGYAFGLCEELWRDVGADACAPDAAAAVQVAHRLVAG